MNARNLLILDSNVSWVRSLAEGMRRQAVCPVNVIEIECIGAWYAVKRGKLPGHKEGWDCQILTLGWNRFAAISTGICVRSLHQLISRTRGETAVVFTKPWYSDVARKLEGVRKIYYAYDYYRGYDGWDETEVVRRERMMMRECDMAFAVSPALVEDLAMLGHAPVHLSPNATNSAFLKARSAGTHEVPPELARLRRPVAGCVGEIHPRAYDWDWIEALARAFPETTFVFIGHRGRETAQEAARIDRIFGMDNVHWLGGRPHGTLPDYLDAFDVCLNPLAVNDFNQRRSLLRFYDYFTTAKPVLSTAIADARVHGEHVAIANNTGEACNLLESMLAGGHAVDPAGRLNYMADHTWDRRAAAMVRKVFASSSCSHPP